MTESRRGNRLEASPAVAVHGLTKTFPVPLHPARGVVAVKDLNLRIEPGEVFGLLGPNGSGKSTTLKIILGLVSPTDGRTEIFGRDSRLVESREAVGFLPENPYFYKYLSGEETLRFFGRLCGLRGVRLRERINELLELVGLTTARKRRLSTYSKGMLQRIGLAQAILNQPDLVLLDELVSGLDPVGQRDMRELLRQLKAGGMSIFLNSHQLADVEALCDRVAIINQGRILKVGAPHSLFDEPLTIEVRVDAVSKQLLHRLGSVALAVRQDEMEPCCLLVEVQNDEATADVAAIVHECGARLYTLAPHQRSLEQLFLRTIDASNN